MRHITATRRGILAMLEPVVASLVAVRLARETMNGTTSDRRRGRPLRDRLAQTAR
jgi:hypothetical protein